MYGFSSRCTVASADDKVMVMIHEVATKPEQDQHDVLPRQNGSSFSSIATDPWPCGLSAATRRYIGSIPSRVSATISSVASGDKAPGGQDGDAGQIGEGGEVVDPGQAHHLPPGLRLRMLLVGFRPDRLLTRFAINQPVSRPADDTVDGAAGSGARTRDPLFRCPTV